MTFKIIKEPLKQIQTALIEYQDLLDSIPNVKMCADDPVRMEYTKVLRTKVKEIRSLVVALKTTLLGSDVSPSDIKIIIETAGDLLSEAEFKEKEKYYLITTQSIQR